MRQQLNEPVKVLFISDPGKRVQIQALYWRHRQWLVQQQSYVYAIPKGSGKCHVFCLVAGGQYFELILDPETMIFVLREVHDGLPD